MSWNGSNLSWVVEPRHPEEQYLDLLRECVAKYEADPTPKEDRTGVGTYGVFGRQIRFDLAKGFPLLTTKRVFFRGLVAELLWMLDGDTNNRTLVNQDVHIWDEWADEYGELGPIYGKQWRSWTAPPKHSYHEERYIDQIADVIKSLRENPNSRRHIVSAWNPADLPAMALAPCHCLFQFNVDGGKLNCQLYQRSADIMLGVPFNIASYALLTHLMAREVGLEVGEFIHTFGDLHLYSNHVEAAKEQLSRTPRRFPHLFVDPFVFADKGLFGIEASDISVDGYDPHPPIKAKVAV